MSTADSAAPAVSAALVFDTGISASDGLTSDAALAGVTAPYGTVTLLEGATLLGTATADGSGNWRFDATARLADGAHSLTVNTDPDAAGAVGTATISFTLETRAIPPTLSLAVDSGIVGDQRTNDPALVGTAEPNSNLVISDGIDTLGKASADANGNWSFTPPLADGNHVLTAFETDPAGNTGSATLAFALDTAAPLVTVSLASDTGSSHSDALTDDPALRGTAQPGSLVTISDDGAILGRVTAAADGGWSMLPTLADGSVTLTASGTDSVGNVGRASLAFTLDTAAVGLTLALASAAGSPTPDPTPDPTTSNPALTGTAEPGSSILVTDGAAALGIVTAGVDGQWSFTPTLADGNYTLTGYETDLAGNIASASLAFTLHAAAPAATITSIAASPASGDLTAGQVITLTVTVSQPVEVTGDPTLSLDDGGVATYDAAHSTATRLVFSYKVAGGQNAADLTVTGLHFQDATIAVPAVLGFDPASSLAAGARPSAVATADVNHDGHLDLVVASLDGSVSVLLGDGRGGFAAQSTYATGSDPFSVAVADVNADGNADLIVPNSIGNSVSVLLGDGSGGFAAPSTFATGSTPYGVATADLNHDGKTDLIVANSDANSVSVLLGDGSGGFAASTSYATGGYAQSVAVADLNGDGHDDLVVANSSSMSVAVLLGDGNGGFAPATTYAVAGYASAVATADVNGDGPLDLVTANRSTGTISVLLGDGSGGFASQTSFSTGSGSQPDAITVADMNDDAIPDIVVNATNGVSVLLGDGRGGFASARHFATPAHPDALTSADFDGDGKPDLVVATHGTNDTRGGLAVLLNRSSQGGTLDSAAARTAPGADTGLVVDTVAPAVTIGLLSDTGASATDRITADATLGGTAEAGGVVSISNAGAVLGSITAAPDGSWRYSPTLADGAYSLAASETDSPGNTGTAALDFTLATTPPQAPAGLTLSPASDSATLGDDITNVAQPTITGTGIAGDGVGLGEGGTLLGTATVAGDGSWSITPTVMLDDGPHSLTATQTDPAGNRSAASAALLLYLDRASPTASQITQTATEGLTGTAEPGSTITLQQGASPLDGTRADAGGAWFFLPSTLAAGSYSLSVTVTDAAGNVSAASAALSVMVAPDHGFTIDAGTDGLLTQSRYDATDRLQQTDTLGPTGLLLQSVTADATRHNIFAGDGSLIGTVSEAGSPIGVAPPGYASQARVGGAYTTTGPFPDAVHLLSGSQSLALSGADLVAIDGGSDTISAGSAPVTVQGGAGQLTFYGGEAAATVDGGRGGATLFGGSGGGLYGGGGGGGNLLVAAAGNTSLVGGSGGGDLLFGGAGPTAIFGSAEGGDTLAGGSGPALIVGERGDNLFVGGAGAATVFGGTGSDTVCTGPGRMTAILGGGADVVSLQSGAASVFAGAGRDIFNLVKGQAGGTSLIAGFKPGIDQIALYGYDTGATLQQGAGGTIISLSDGSRITLLGVSAVAASSVIG